MKSAVAGILLSNNNWTQIELTPVFQNFLPTLQNLQSLNDTMGTPLKSAWSVGAKISCSEGANPLSFT